MNNEIGRKITSLTLMTIMLAGGMVIAAPSMMPAAHAANANLFVSAENSQFDNYMSGPQVIEVVVIDSDINDTDEAKGEPDVTVNGKILRMVQAVDGNWYGYFADRDMAVTADTTTTVDNEGIDFGQFCSADSAEALIGPSFTDSVGVAVPMVTGSTGATGAAVAANNNIIDEVAVPTTICVAQTPAAGGDADIDEEVVNVVREQKDANSNVSVLDGQIGLTDYDSDIGSAAAQHVWPFIQLYPLNPTGNVVVQYNKGGGSQTTTLTFDTVDEFASADLDRAAYTPGSDVHGNYYRSLVKH